MAEETGYLRILVTEANGTLPIAGAVVTVTDYRPGPESENNVLYLLRTGRDGNTETVSLETPPASESLSPGSVSPGGLYGVTVTFPGYYRVETVGTPVFSGVVSLQAVDLMPMASLPGMGPGDGRVFIYETPGVESLEPGGLRREDIGNRNGTLSGGVAREDGNGGVPGGSGREEGGNP